MDFLISRSPECTVIGTGMKPVPAPLMPWLLSAVTFGLVGLFLGALIPNRRRPVKRASDEADAARPIFTETSSKTTVPVFGENPLAGAFSFSETENNV